MSLRKSQLMVGTPAWIPASTLLAYVLALAFNLFMLYIVANIERNGCTCARDWRLTFITNYTTFAVVWVAAVIVVSLISPAVLTHPAFLTASLLVSLVYLANLVIALQYISGLRKEHCKCSESTMRSIWEVLLWLRVALLVISFFMMIVGGLMLHSLISKR
jgi:hypothetical protein